MAKGDRIVNTTFVSIVLDPPNSYDETKTNQSFNLTEFYLVKYRKNTR